MNATLADPRLTLWQTRATTIRQLTAMRVERAHTCGCRACGDGDNGSLDARIRVAVAQVATLTEQILEASCTRS